MKRMILIIALLLSVVAVYGQGRIIFQENFDKPAATSRLDALGWSVKVKPDCSSYTVKDGRLFIRITPHKFHDGYAEIEVPVCRKGQLDFDACIDHGSTGERGTGLTMDLYNISTFWHDYCEDWRLYFPEAVSRRMNGFNIEPVGHQAIGPFKKSKWSHYRIIFDTDKDRVECFIDDMNDPAFIKGDAAVLGRSEYQGGKLRIGSMGVCNGPYECVIDNIILRSNDDEPQSIAEIPAELYLLFRGIAFDYYNISGILQSSGIKLQNIRNYDLTLWRSSYTAENPFKYDKLPGNNSIRHAKTIVMIDAPCGPRGALPDFILKDIVQRVEDGARLVIFGGLFTLDKGEFWGTPLAEILPVEIPKTAWQVKGSAEPLTIEPVDSQFSKIDWSAKPCVYYYHDLTLKKDASVLLRAGGKPLLVSGKYGKGEVVVFLGTVCGPASEPPPAFWKWKNWPALAAEIITQ